MILGERLFHELQDERMACIEGSLSAGKTRLSFDIALSFWRRGYRVLSNIPHNYKGVKPHTKANLLHRTFVILDEGGEYIREQTIASQITRTAGKANYFILFPGKKLPHKNLQGMIIVPRFNFLANFGIPLILWRANVRASTKYHFNFWQIFPQLVHGTYSTKTSSGSIEPFMVMAQNTIELLAKEEGQQAGQAVAASLSGFYDDLAGGTMAIPEADLRGA